MKIYLVTYDYRGVLVNVAFANKQTAIDDTAKDIFNELTEEMGYTEKEIQENNWTEENIKKDLTEHFRWDNEYCEYYVNIEEMEVIE